MGTISILLEREINGFRASVLGLPDCQAQGATREDALSNVRKALNTRLESAEVVMIPLDSSSVPKLAAGLSRAGSRGHSRGAAGFVQRAL